MKYPPLSLQEIKYERGLAKSKQAASRSVNPGCMLPQG